MVKKEVLANLIDSKKASILRIILNSKDEMYLKEIAEKSKVVGIHYCRFDSSLPCCIYYCCRQ